MDGVLKKRTQFGVGSLLPNAYSGRAIRVRPNEGCQLLAVSCQLSAFSIAFAALRGEGSQARQYVPGVSKKRTQFATELQQEMCSDVRSAVQEAVAVS